MHTCIRRQEVGIGYFHGSLSTLFFFLEQAFTEPGAPGLSKTSWPASSGSSVSVSPAEGYKHSSLHPVFYVGAEIQAQALMLTMAGTSF